MTSLLNDLQAKSALLQIQNSNRGRFDNVLTGARKQPLASTQDAFFSISNAVKTESSIFSALNDGLGRARASVALASAGTDKIGSVLDRAEEIIGAVEQGAPGSAFASSLSRLEETATLAVQSAGRTGTNLLVEGETLSVTLGFKAGGAGFDFRQQTIEAVGLGATDGARAASTTVTDTVTDTVTETVEVNVTRRDRFNERLDSLNERVARVGERISATEDRIASATDRRQELSNQAASFRTERADIEQQLADGGARPDDARDQRRVRVAQRVFERSERVRAQGNEDRADRLLARAQRAADRAGVTISLEDLSRLDNRSDRLERSIRRTDRQVVRLDRRIDSLENRVERFNRSQDRLETRVERFENRIASLSEAQLDRVVGTRTETVEREVTRTIESPLAGSFEDVLGDLSDRIRAGDTEGARAIVAEVRERIGNVDNQLGQISDSLNRRGGFFSALTERLDSSVRSLVQPLTEEDAARAAAAAISESNRVSRLFGDGDVRPGILELFQGSQEADSTSTVVEAPEAPEADEEDAA